MTINYDLENSPLQIKTDSEVGSDEKVDVRFYSGSSFTGGVYLSFISPPLYFLLTCSTSWTYFPTDRDLPSETDKVWTITKSKVSDEIRVIIHCNDKEVLNVVLSDTTCSESSWSERWSKDVDKIIFHPSYDTASDYYRPGKQ